MTDKKTSNIQNKVIMVLSLFVFIVITIYRLLHHTPWYDEAQAWNIARYLDLSEIMSIVKTEGHPFLWYFILKPFAVHNLFYPYSLQFINYSFFLAALFVMWKYSPFNIWIKVLITFSFPFLGIYSILARCYAVGILGLFALTVLYQERIKKPLLYASLIFLTANTSIMALVGASAFGLIHLYDLFIDYKKNRNLKEFLAPVFILFFTVMMLFFQYFSLSIPAFVRNFNFAVQASAFFNNFYLHPLFKYLSYFIIPIVSISFIFYVRKNTRCLFFILYCWSFLLLFFNFLYAGQDYHFYFLLIYFIIAYWLYLQGNSDKNIKFDKIFRVLFSLLLLLSCFKVSSSPWCFDSKADKLAKNMAKTPELNSYTIYSSVLYTADLLPYLNSPNIKYYKGGNLYDHKNLLNIYQEDKNIFFDESSVPINNKSLFLIETKYIGKFHSKKVSIKPFIVMDNFSFCKFEKRSK